jgi:endonuclease III
MKRDVKSHDWTPFPSLQECREEIVENHSEKVPNNWLNLILLSGAASKTG